MDEFGKFLSIVFNRVKDFFEVIDLSIIIVGIFGTLMIYWWQFLNEYSFEITHMKDHILLVHIIVAYGIGLICFCIGRPIRRFLRKIFCKDYHGTIEHKCYQQKIEDHKLAQDINIIRYISLGDSSRESLRNFLWSEIRQNNEYGYSMSFLNKYWSMSVIFDSLLGCSFILDFILIDLLFNLVGNYNLTINTSLPYITWIVTLAISIIIKYCIVKMANTYDKYQDDELLASYAALTRKKESENIWR